MHRLMRVAVCSACLAALLGCSPNIETPEARYATAVRARAAFENGDLRHARSLFGDLASGTRDASAWANLGLAQRRSGKLDAAMHAWTRAVQFDRSCAPAQYWLGATRLERGRALRARAQTDAKHAGELGESAIATLRDAARDLEAAAGAAPAEPVILASLAEVYQELGQQTNAQRARESMARLDPTQRSTLASSGLESPRLPSRPRPTTGGQIPVRFAPEVLGVRATQVMAAGAEGGDQAELFLAPSGAVLRSDSLPDGRRWSERGRLTSEDVAASACADLDGDGTSDLVFFTTEPVAPSTATPDAVPSDAAGQSGAKTKRSNVARAAVNPAPPASRPMRGWWAPAGNGARLLGDVPEGVSFVRTADVDHDGDLDLILAVNGKPAVRVWRNDSGRFTLADATPAGIDALPPLRDLVSADFDGDGRADLVAADRGGRLRVLVQRTGGGFTTVTDMAGLYLERARALAAADVDGDGNTDLLIGNDTGLWIYTNRGMARFARQAAYRAPQTSWGAGRAPAVAVVALGVTDLDNDGTCDVLTLHPALEPPTGLWIAATHTEVTKPAPANTGTKPAAEDAAPETPPLPALPAAGLLRAWRNDGRGVLLDTTEMFGIAADTLRCVLPVMADFDHDGDRDLAWVRADSTVVVHWNEGGNANRRILFTLEGASGMRDGAGARLEVHAGDLVQSIEVSAQPVWVGVERHAKLDVVRVVWPDNSIQNWLDLTIPAEGRLRLQRRGNQS
jgi:hypothetical protein